MGLDNSSKMASAQGMGELGVGEVPWTSPTPRSMTQGHLSDSLVSLGLRVYGVGQFLQDGVSPGDGGVG